MVDPIFRKSGTPDVALTQAPDLQSSEPIGPRQVIQRYYNGDHQVLTRGSADVTLNLIFGELPRTEALDLEVFFRASVVNFSERAFTYIDHDGLSRQVRYLQSNLPGIPVGPETRRVSMTLRIDNGVLD